MLLLCSPPVSKWQLHPTPFIPFISKSYWLSSKYTQQLVITTTTAGLPTSTLAPLQSLFLIVASGILLNTSCSEPLGLPTSVRKNQSHHSSLHSPMWPGLQPPPHLSSDHSLLCYFAPATSSSLSLCTYFTYTALCLLFHLPGNSTPHFNYIST